MPFSFNRPVAGASRASAPTEVDSFDALMDAVEGLNRSTTLVVAATDASQKVKDAADYLCDGTADDVQINAAIAALGATGGTIVLSEGTFTVAESGSVVGDSLTTPYCILIDASDGPLSIVGSGRNATKIVLADTQDANSIPLLIRGASAGKRTNPTRIAHLEIDGNSAGQVATWTDFGVLEAVYADNVTVEDVYVHDGPYFLTQTFRNSNKIHFVRCQFLSSSANHQVRFEAPGVTVEDCDFEGAAAAASGALLSLATNADISMTTRDARILNNRFVGGFTAIDCGGGQRNLIAQNIIRDQTHTNSISIKIQHYSGAVTFDATENMVIGNSLYNIRNGIQLGGTTDFGSLRNLVQNNLIVEGPDISLSNGIQESGTATNDNTIRYNRIYGATTPVTTVGATTIAQDNIGAATTQLSITGITVSESDGSPDVTGVREIVVSNGTLTDNGSGVVTITTGGGGGGSVGTKSINVINGNVGSVTVAVPTVAVAEVLSRLRTAADLTQYTEARIILNVVTANSPTAEYGIQYSTNSGSTWTWLDGTADASTGTPRRAITAIGVGVSAWATLTAGAKADVWLRLVHLTAAGTAPVFARVDYEFR